MALMLEPFVTPSTTTDGDLFYLFLMGFILLPVAASLMFIGPKYISAPEVSLMMLLESIIGPFWVWLVLREHPGNQTLIGGSLVLITLSVHSFIAMRSSAKRE
jgi:drug/metabolite transporter (DMT)-like permease